MSRTPSTRSMTQPGSSEQCSSPNRPDHRHICKIEDQQGLIPRLTITTNTQRVSRSCPPHTLRWTTLARPSRPAPSSLALGPAAFASTHNRPVVRSQKFQPSSPTSTCSVCSKECETGLHGHRAPNCQALPAQAEASTTRTPAPGHLTITR